MATPHVSGVAALIRSERPDFAVNQGAQIITSTAHDVADPGWDVVSGWGRLDAYAAVKYAAFLHKVFLPLTIGQ
jgi:serine protease